MPSLPPLQDVHPLVVTLMGGALHELQARDLSELRGCSKKQLGNVSMEIVRNKLVTLAESRGGGVVVVEQREEPLCLLARQGDGVVHVLVYAVHRPSLCESDEPDIEGQCTNRVSKDVWKWIQDLNTNSLLENATPPVAIFCVELAYHSLAEAPRVEIVGSWLAYPSEVDAQRRTISGWHDGALTIPIVWDLEAEIAGSADIRDEEIPDLHKILPFRFRRFSEDGEPDPSEERDDSDPDEG